MFYHFHFLLFLGNNTLIKSILSNMIVPEFSLSYFLLFFIKKIFLSFACLLYFAKLCVVPFPRIFVKPMDDKMVEF